MSEKVMEKMVKLPLINRSIRVAYLIFFSLILFGSIAAYAASVTINVSTNAGYQGEYVVDNGYFTVSAMTYNVVEAAQTASGNPVSWTTNGQVAYESALVAGDWEIAWTLTIFSSSVLASHTYTITLTSTAASGAPSTVYTYGVTTPSTITTGWTITILYDTGSQTWTAPAAMQITVQ